jgi:hypothetical protein
MAVRKDFAPGEFCWIDLMAHDLESAATWYGNLFGWTHFQMETPEGAPPYAFFMKGEAAVGGLGQMDDQMKGMGIPPMWNSYFCTADCEATEAKAKELGATVTVPTTEVPGYGKLAFFQDPEGASIATWQSISDEGPGVLTAEPGGMSWIELMTRDTTKASEFYGKLVGWDFAAMPMGEIEYTMIKNAGKDAGGMMPMAGPQFEGIPAHWMVYFAVEDCDATAAKVDGSGGKVLVPPTEIPVGKFSCCCDPQGGGFAVITVTNPTC